MNKNNKTIISIVSIIVALVICFFGYNLYQKKQAEVVSAEKLTALHELTKQFNNENDRNNKFNLLKDTLDEQSKYNLNSYKDPKVKDEFKNSINIMRDYFHRDYDNTIKENNISDLNNTSDESKFSDKKAKLDDLTKVKKKRIARSYRRFTSTFVIDRSLGITMRKCKTNRGVCRELFSLFAPIFYEGDITRCFECCHFY